MKTEINHYIYRITNQINKKVYIGQTNSPTTRRWNHKNYSYNKHFRSAKAKYGIDAFLFEVIETTTCDNVDARERFWIAYYGSTNPQNGYNKESGGHKHKKMHEETKISIGNALRGRKLSKQQIEQRVNTRRKNGNLYHNAEERQKISDNTTGKSKSPRSDEHKEKIRKNQTGKIMSAESIQKRTETRRKNNNGNY